MDGPVSLLYISIERCCSRLSSKKFCFKVDLDCYQNPQLNKVQRINEYGLLFPLDRSTCKALHLKVRKYHRCHFKNILRIRDWGTFFLKGGIYSIPSKPQECITKKKKLKELDNMDKSNKMLSFWTDVTIAVMISHCNSPH